MKNKQNRGAAIRESASERTLVIICIILLSIFSFACIYPFYYTIIGSITSATDVTQVVLWPKHLSFATYSQIFAMPGLFQSMIISFSRTVLGTALTVYFSAMLGYLVTKKMLLRKFVYRFCVVTMYINAGLIPWYLTMKMYGFYNNYLIYIIPSAVSAFYMIIIKTYIESLPASLEESAEIDGAGFLTVFNRIIFPISKPILATVAVYAAVGQWNSWQDNFFLIDKQSLTTLSYNLYLVLNQAQVLANQMMSKTPGSTSPVSSPISSVTVQMAMVVVTVLPIMLVYPFLQRFFTKGIMLGAVKG